MSNPIVILSNAERALLGAGADYKGDLTSNIRYTNPKEKVMQTALRFRIGTVTPTIESDGPLSNAWKLVPEFSRQDRVMISVVSDPGYSRVFFPDINKRGVISLPSNPTLDFGAFTIPVDESPSHKPVRERKSAPIVFNGMTAAQLKKAGYIHFGRKFGRVWLEGTNAKSSVDNRTEKQQKADLIAYRSLLKLIWQVKEKEQVFKANARIARRYGNKVRQFIRNQKVSAEAKGIKWEKKMERAGKRFINRKERLRRKARNGYVRKAFAKRINLPAKKRIVQVTVRSIMSRFHKVDRSWMTTTCHGITLKGEACKRTVKGGGYFCKDHLDNTVLPEWPADAEIDAQGSADDRYGNHPMPHGAKFTIYSEGNNGEPVFFMTTNSKLKASFLCFGGRMVYVDFPINPFPSIYKES